jgi:LasA protease
VSLYKKFIPFVLVFFLAACLPQSAGTMIPFPTTPTPQPTPTSVATPSRPHFSPGQLVDYVAQSGDSLAALAAHFNTTVDQIRTANPQIPAETTTMPPGMPMKIPIYYLPFWGTTVQILPDSQFVDGPSTVGFDTAAFVSSHPGWLKDYYAYAGGDNHSGAEIVDMVAIDYSISPRVLLALLEYQTGALSQPVAPTGDYPLGNVDYNYASLYLQLIWAANILNVGYYDWRNGSLTELSHPDGTLERPDPWQTAGTVAFQYYFALNSPMFEYTRATGPDGMARVYQTLFGDPFAPDVNQPHIPVSLQQPDLGFPFADGETWSLTGGPHSGWGTAALQPWSALDFGPPVKGCNPYNHPVVAMADGVVVRSETGLVIEDLDGDGKEQTGWDLLYLHIAAVGRDQVGQKLKRGDPIGFPSCEGGEATGTHVHIARKYNGEWMPADSIIPFDLEGWIAHNGDGAYSGYLTRGTQIVTACTCSDAASHITAGK